MRMFVGVVVALVLLGVMSLPRGTQPETYIVSSGEREAREIIFQPTGELDEGSSGYVSPTYCNPESGFSHMNEVLSASVRKWKGENPEWTVLSSFEVADTWHMIVVRKIEQLPSSQ